MVVGRKEAGIRLDESLREAGIVVKNHQDLVGSSGSDSASVTVLVNHAISSNER